MTSCYGGRSWVAENAAQSLGCAQSGQEDSTFVGDVEGAWPAVPLEELHYMLTRLAEPFEEQENI